METVAVSSSGGKKASEVSLGVEWQPRKRVRRGIQQDGRIK
jgi:hypothetical protein